VLGPSVGSLSILPHLIKSASVIPHREDAMQDDNVDSQGTVNGDDHNESDSVAELESDESPNSFPRDIRHIDSDDESVTDSQRYMESQFLRRIQELRAQLASSSPAHSKMSHLNQSMAMPGFRSATGLIPMHRSNMTECLILQRAHELTTPDLC
jgi:hypothetical protein